ncbi:MAG: hypothetical protein HQM08_15180 [Candidatus Riflebacteria bacterium]|nr:hypothetical protein [Candidatus Riflebacteria bacterium]
MSKIRGVVDFQQLWKRRTTIEFEKGGIIELMALSDLVQAKNEKPGSCGIGLFTFFIVPLHLHWVKEVSPTFD